MENEYQNEKKGGGARADKVSRQKLKQAMNYRI
jgi:hypothetical protein